MSFDEQIAWARVEEVRSMTSRLADARRATRGRRVRVRWWSRVRADESATDDPTA